MSKNILLTIATLLLFVIIIFTIVKFLNNGSRSLVSPGAVKVMTRSTPQPSTSAYNPPKEIKYDGSTDLQKELDSVDPKVLDSDFSSL